MDLMQPSHQETWPLRPWPGSLELLNALWRQRHPGFEALPVTEQWQLLARITRQPTRHIGQALRPRLEERLSSTEFTRQVAYLQTLRNAL